MVLLRARRRRCIPSSSYIASLIRLASRQNPRHSHIIDIHEESAADARRMTVVHTDTQQHGDGSVDSRSAEIQNSPAGPSRERDEEHRKTYRPTLDASSESEATAPCLHRMKEDSPPNP
jgi:hypothetical protein